MSNSITQGKDSNGNRLPISYLNIDGQEYQVGLTEVEYNNYLNITADEGKRAEAEGLRKTAEEDRAREEGLRFSNETERRKKEDERIDAEKARADAENERKTAETKRNNSENIRIANTTVTQTYLNQFGMTATPSETLDTATLILTSPKPIEIDETTGKFTVADEPDIRSIELTMPNSMGYSLYTARGVGITSSEKSWNEDKIVGSCYTDDGSIVSVYCHHFAPNFSQAQRPDLLTDSNNKLLATDTKGMMSIGIDRKLISDAAGNFIVGSNNNNNHLTPVNISATNPNTNKKETINSTFNVALKNVCLENTVIGALNLAAKKTITINFLPEVVYDKIEKIWNYEFIKYTLDNYTGNESELQKLTRANYTGKAITFTTLNDSSTLTHTFSANTSKTKANFVGFEGWIYYIRKPNSVWSSDSE